MQSSMCGYWGGFVVEGTLESLSWLFIAPPLQFVKLCGRLGIYGYTYTSSKVHIMDDLDLSWFSSNADKMRDLF